MHKKLVNPKTPEWKAAGRDLTPNPVTEWKKFLLLGLILFGTEMLIMALFYHVDVNGRFSPFSVAVMDSALLLLIVFWPFYFFLFRPMRLRIAALQEAKAEIREKSRELAIMVGRNEMILSAAEEGILGLDEKGATIFVNPAAEELLGWSASELIGTDHHGQLGHAVCYAAAKDPRGICPVQRSLSNGEISRHIETSFMRKDGRSFPAEISCAPMKEEPQWVRKSFSNLSPTRSPQGGRPQVYPRASALPSGGATARVWMHC